MTTTIPPNTNTFIQWRGAIGSHKRSGGGGDPTLSGFTDKYKYKYNEKYKYNDTSQLEVIRGLVVVVTPRYQATMKLVKLRSMKRDAHTNTRRTRIQVCDKRKIQKYMCAMSNECTWNVWYLKEMNKGKKFTTRINTRLTKGRGNRAPRAYHTIVNEHTTQSLILWNLMCQGVWGKMLKSEMNKAPFFSSWCCFFRMVVDS